jgi:TolB-like protein
VSPFVNLGDPEDSYFADGLMMGLVIALMRIPGLDVISETSSLGYRDHPFSAQQIGHELGVRYVLEGAVQRSGDTVRVMTQVLDVEEGTTTWADRFEATFDDIFEAQDDIVFSIVAALDIELIRGEVARAYRSNLDAASVEDGYRGLQHLSKGTPEDLRLAVADFEKVIERQPDSPSGYMMAALAHLWTALFVPGADEDASYAEAERFAHMAIERDDESGMGQTVLAHSMVFRHDWDGALEAARLAIAARPSCDLSYGVAASVMRYAGEVDDAVDYATRAIRLSPLFSGWYESIMANAQFVAGNYDKAAEIAESVVAEDDQQIEALLTLAASQSALGQQRHAAAALEHARETRPGMTVETLRHDFPYRDEEALSRFIEELESSGLE